MLLPVRPLRIRDEDTQIERSRPAAGEAPAGRAGFFQDCQRPEWRKETIVTHRTEAPAEPAGPAGVLTEAGAIDHDRQARLNDLDRNILHGAHRDVLRGVDPVAIDAGAPADAGIGLMPDLAAGIGFLAVESGIAKIAAGTGPHLVRYR